MLTAKAQISLCILTVWSGHSLSTKRITGYLRMVQCIAPDKALFFNRKVFIFLLFLHKNICYGYSLEAPQRGVSNEYPQHMFLWRNKNNIIWIPPLTQSYVNGEQMLHKTLRICRMMWIHTVCSCSKVLFTWHDPYVISVNKLWGCDGQDVVNWKLHFLFPKKKGFWQKYWNKK